MERNEAIRIVRNHLPQGSFKTLREALETLIPELKESEDEKIRKELIAYLDVQEAITDKNDPNFKRWIAWLEKQGSKDKLIQELSEYKAKYTQEVLSQQLEKLSEQDSTDEQNQTAMIKPDFKVGDWIVAGNNVGQISEIREFHYVVLGTGGEIINLSRPEGNSTAHLWSIKDAKDGDVLYTKGFYGDCIFIFNGLDRWKFDEPNGDRAVATGHCCLTLSGNRMEFGTQGPDCIEVDTVTPATKEQCDTLFAKMKEAGYEWDNDKKMVV